MFTIPTHNRMMMYGPEMINVEAEPIYSDEYHLLPELLKYMLPLMDKHNGIGLAAPQVGVFKQFYLLETDEGDILNLVNPEIKEMYGTAITDFEACLSIPPNGNGCPVERCNCVEIEYSTVETELRTQRRFNGMDSRVAQHEFDHLTGTFFIDRANPSWKKKVLDIFNKWKGKQDAANQTRTLSVVSSNGVLPHLRQTTQALANQRP